MGNGKIKKILLTIAAVVLAAAMTGAETPAPEAVEGEVYSWDIAGCTYHYIREDRYASPTLLEELTGYKPVRDGVPEKGAEELLGFLALTDGGGKESYYLTKTQLRSKDRGVLDATPSRCKELYEMAQDNNRSQRANAQWLRHMSRSKLTEVKFSGNAPDEYATDISFTTSEAQVMENMARALSGLAVQPHSVTRFEEGSSLSPNVGPDAITIKLTLDTGVVYDIWLSDSSLHLFASNMSFSLGYALPPDTVVRDDFRTNKETSRVRSFAEGIYYRLHPEIPLPPRLWLNPD